MNRRTRARIITAVIGAAVIFGGILIFRNVNAAEPAVVSHTVLQWVYLADSVSLRGVVESTNRRYVHSMSNLWISEIFAGLGDQVHEGQVLAVLDMGGGDIVSPINGTITLVLARIGVPAAGLLFVVEDTNNLQIVTGIREFDIARIYEGMSVEIRSDATGDERFLGRVASIAPTASRSPQGDVEFAAVVEVVSTGTPLRIGTNARLNVILQHRENIFAVPFDAIGSDADGAFVFVLDEFSEFFQNNRGRLTPPAHQKGQS